MSAPTFPTDLSTPGAIDRLLAAHRSIFGDLRMVEEPSDGGSQETPPEEQPTPPADKGFPADTPLSEMSVEQREAYWKDKARKHEQRANERSDYDAIKAKAERLDEIERANESEKDRAVREAAEQARAATRAEVQQETTAAMARMALRARGVKDEEIASFVAETNLSVFVNDEGQVDDERLLARVDRYAGTASTTKWPGTGQDRRGGGSQKPSGDDLYEKHYGTKK
ncbi:hypothetical protein [Janibacter terrae]|uniref:hypothetical protein n=1 Tax=Janibacter terrae TaxID=103817 RepID=UPI0031F9AE37